MVQILSSRNWRKARATAVTLTILLLTLTSQLVRAHTRVEIGPYAVVVGWEVEPPVVGERNNLTIEITQGEEPFSGAEAGLDVELLYGGSSFRTNLNPTETPGFYTAAIFPTVRGQYAVRLFGTLGETAVDEIIEPEEVFSAARIQFPEAAPEPRDLQQRINTLETNLNTARTLAIGGLGMGLLGTILALLAFQRRK